MSDDGEFFFWAPVTEPPLRFRVWWAISRVVGRFNPRRGKWVEVGSTIDYSDEGTGVA